jgi:hypothetical protein
MVFFRACVLLYAVFAYRSVYINKQYQTHKREKKKLLSLLN